MDLIKMEINETMKEKKMGVQIIKKKSTTDAASSSRSSSSTAQKVTTMVGFDDLLSEMLDKLNGEEVNRQIIPIIGMGGLGKTTLARNVYENPLIKERFHVCAWSTISQVHNTTKILSEILDQVYKQGMMGDLSENELGDNLYQYLIGRRYLIVMDDIWSIEAWDRVRCYFPNNTHGSRIVITTRLSNLAFQFNPSNSLEMKFLDEGSSWNLFSITVFGEEICPPELEEIGKQIVKGCRGLPLSIVVAGGLLSKSKSTRENWEVIGKNLSSVVNSEDDESCLQILYTSYNNLPVYIKPCFLHLGLSEEDDKIPVNIQISLWVAEGFIRPRDGKSLEEVAEEYVEELIDRNLILVEERDGCGDVAAFKVHDLVRDLAMREAEKGRLLYSLMMKRDTEISQGIISTHRCIAITLDEEYPLKKISIHEEGGEYLLGRNSMGEYPDEFLSLPSFGLLRVAKKKCYEYNEEIYTRLLSLRFLFVSADHLLLLKIPSYLWNLQTVYIVGRYGENYCDLVIWKMPQLRVVITQNPFRLPNPPVGGEEVVLENLHTLSRVGNLKFSEELLKRIPNVRILKLYYDDDYEENDLVEDADADADAKKKKKKKKKNKKKKKKKKKKKYDHCLHNLHRLNKLQDLHLFREEWYYPSMQELTLPYSLKQLTLHNTKLPWKEMASKIGCLPLLQFLRLKHKSFVGSDWETVEGQFPNLKFLEIEGCYDLECWITDDSTHFPCLQHLVLKNVTRLGEIPSSIGDIPTLRSIELEFCNDSVEESARRIVDEQEEMGNEYIQLEVNWQRYS